MIPAEHNHVWATLGDSRTCLLCLRREMQEIWAAWEPKHHPRKKKQA